MKSISKSIMIFAMAAIVYSAAMAGEINQAKNDEQSVVTAVINRTITYQGLLKNSSGTLVPNNTYNITFKVYKQPSGGSALWTSALTPVATSSGLFSTPVGPISLPFDTTYYISLQVQGDVEMSRQQITMSAYSASSDTANYAKAALSNWIVSNNVIYTNGAWGIARGMANNSLFGTNANTHVNLGDYSTTGTNAQNYSYCTIGGGHLNTASANYSTVSCGYMNTANGNFSTISGGSTNTASGYSAFVGSGFQNTANGDYSMMGGGINNITSGITSVIAGGNTNKSMSTSTSVGGGQYNTAVTGQSTIGGGQYNYAVGQASTIGGGDADSTKGIFCGVFSGRSNLAGSVYEDTGAFVGGGYNNTASTKFATVGGGYNNLASGVYSSVCGGNLDTASNSYCTVLGGSHNVASGWGSMIPGGSDNVAGGTYSFAGGLGAHANHNGCFIWGDDFPASYASDRAGQTKFKSYGGIKFDVNSLTRWVEIWDNGSGRLINTSTGAYLTVSGVWTDVSDRNLKENFVAIDGSDLLNRISQLSITRWNYKSDDKSITHIGPMAQDFKRLFEVGNDSTTISSLDPAGVALAGVQELIKRMDALEKENAKIKAELNQLKSKVQ